MKAILQTRKVFYAFFIVAQVFMLSTCGGADVYLTQESKVTIQGIVKLTRNGAPLNPDDFPHDISKNNQNMPIIQAFTTQPKFNPLYEEGFFLGTFGNTQPIGGSVDIWGNNLVTWIGDGEYQGFRQFSLHGISRSRNYRYYRFKEY